FGVFQRRRDDDILVGGSNLDVCHPERLEGIDVRPSRTGISGLEEAAALLAAIATAVLEGSTSIATVRPPHWMLGWNGITEGGSAQADTPRLNTMMLKD